MPRVMLKCAVLAVAAVVGGCAVFSDEPEYYGYEEEFVYPEPDIIPSMPDDDPGRSVDEMLGAQEDDAAKDTAVYEHEGRFGSKEKISLRKGLNAPVTGIEYAADAKEPVSVVRPLELKAAEKKNEGKTEEEILAEIVSPPEEPVNMVELVSEKAVLKDKGEEVAVEETAVEEEGAPVVLTPPASAVAAPVSSEKDALPKLPSGEDGYSRQPPLSEFVAPAPAAVSEPAPVAAPAPEIAAVPLVPPSAPVYEPLPVAPEPEFTLTPPSAAPAQDFQLIPPQGSFEAPAQETITLTPPSSAQPAAPAFEQNLPQAPAPQFQQQDASLGVSQNVALIAFPAGQTVLPSAASAEVSSAVFALRRQAFGRLLVIGYDAPDGKRGSVATAQRRADAVSAALIRSGVAAAQIRTEAMATAPYGEKSGNFAEIYLEY